MADPYSYRKARSDKRAQIFQRYRTVMRSYIEQIWGWDEQWQESEFMEHFEPDQITVALVGEKLVGYAQVEPQIEALYIRMLLLTEEYRRQGIGALILGLALSAASEQHLGVKLQIFRINESAKRFYERHGFRVVGETSTSLEMEFDA